MRAREFIIEYDRSMTLKSWEQKLTARMASDQSAPDSIDEIMEMIETADPTRNKMYTQWIVKRYTAGDFAADDLDQVNLRLTDYDSVKRVLTTGKDINQLSYAQLPDIISAGNAQKTAPKFEVIPDTEVLYNGPDGQLAVPKTEEASRALGSGTAWCTAYTDRDTMFNRYNRTGKIYTWRSKNGDKFQFFWGHDIQFMNSANLPLSPKDMHFFRSINPPTKKLFAEYEDEVLKGTNKNRIIKLFNVLDKSQAVWEEGLEQITLDPELAYYYAQKIGERFPNGEAAIATIATSAEWSYYYARWVGEPFPDGEKAIATSAEYSYLYALKVQRGKPFPAGEAAIATDAEYSCKYACEVIGEFPAGEAAIATDAESSAEYAYMVVGRFPAGEAAIATSASASYKYATGALHGKRFPAGEAAIATDARLACDYSSEVLDRNPFPAGEPAIATDARISYEYATIINKRFPLGEKIIASNSEYAILYDEQFGTNLSQQ